MSDPREYTIGWISALSIEHTAARLFLDREHDPPEPDLIAATDNNAYTLGEIKGHKIVIAVLPQGEYGTSTAASVATNMLHSFPNIRVAVMVGIGGGAPTAENDIRLGDVVVSIPKDGRGGVYQYDYGKRIQGREFQATGHLNQPPPVVLTAISKLKSNYDIEGHKIDEAIKGILEEKPRLKNQFSRPPPDADVLYASHVTHPVDEPSSPSKEVCIGQSPGAIDRRKRAASDADSPSHRGKKRYSNRSRGSDLGSSIVVFHRDGQELQVREDCEEARLSRTIDRPERDVDDDDPAIHHGSIASGNSLMKDALVRDELATKQGILCFEMEAAGIMNNLPCLVVRGICDYSDSHKSKRWQGYAAMTAAAYTKDLLKIMVPKRVESEKRLAPILESLFSKMTSIQNILETSQEQQQTQQIRRWLSPPDPSINLDKALERRHPDTCRWLLDSDEYRSWRTTPSSFLWIHGLSGCGKTVLASAIVHQLQLEGSKVVVAYHYFDVNGGDRRDVCQMLRSLLFQLCSGHPAARKILQALYIRCDKGSRQPTTRQLFEQFTSILSQIDEVAVVVDGLDECEAPDEIVSWLENLNRVDRYSLCLLVTSRKQGRLAKAIDDWPKPDQLYGIMSADTNRDIAEYTHARIFEGKEFVKWNPHEGLQEHVEQVILQRANGMFRLAACQLDDLRSCIDRPRLMAALETLPTTLQDMYARLLHTLENSHCYREALFILQYVLWSDSPPSFPEMIDAIAVRLDESPVFRVENRLFDLMDVVVQCSSLLSVVDTRRLQYCHRQRRFKRPKRREIHFAHSSVKEYLKSQHLVRPFDRILSEVHARAIIAKTCIAYTIDVASLHYVSHVRGQTSASSGSQGLRRRQSPPGRRTLPLGRMNDTEFPFIGPACLWIEHVKVSEATDDDIVQLVLHLYRQERLIQSFPLILGPGVSDSLSEFRESRHPWILVSPESSPQFHPLMHACFWGLNSVAQFLLKDGAEVNLPGSFGSPLQAASHNGHREIVQMLLDRGAAVNDCSKDSQWILSGGVVCTLHLFPLLEASSGGHVEIVRTLLQHGARIDTQDEFGGTAIELAAKNGHCKVVQCLLDHDACRPYALIPDVYERALYAATQFSREEIVRLLVQSVTYNGSPWLAHCLVTAAGLSLGMVEALLQTGAYNHICLNNAAVAAITAGSNTILEILLNHGATPNGCEHTENASLLSHDHTPNLLLLAMQVIPINEVVIDTLCSRGAKLDAQTSSMKFKQTLEHLRKCCDKDTSIYIGDTGRTDESWRVDQARRVSNERLPDEQGIARILWEQAGIHDDGLVQMLWIQGEEQLPSPASSIACNVNSDSSVGESDSPDTEQSVDLERWRLLRRVVHGSVAVRMVMDY